MIKSTATYYDVTTISIVLTICKIFHLCNYNKINVWKFIKKILLIWSTVLKLGGQTDKMIFLLVFERLMCHVMSCYPEAILRLHVKRRLEEMIPKQIVCIDLISPVLRNWLDSHTLDLFTTNVLPEGGCSLVKSSLWFDWFNGFPYRTF